MVEFLSGVIVGALAGWSIQKSLLYSKLRLMERIGLLKMCAAEDIKPLTEAYFKKQLGKIYKPPEDEE